MPETNTTPFFFDFGTRQARLLSMFMPLAAPIFKNTEITAGFTSSQDHVRRSVDANVALWRGALTAGFSSIDAFGRCLTASRDDFVNAINTANPTEFSQRQISALHDRHRELLGDLRSVSDQLDAVWFQALQSVAFPRPATGTEAGPASSESAELIDIAETSQSTEPNSEAGLDASALSDSGSRRPSPRPRQKDA